MLTRLWIAVKQRFALLVQPLMSMATLNEFDKLNVDEHGTNSVEAVNSIIDPKRHRFPHCIVWTPIPCLTWLFPFIGHMGIATSSGVIRDFAGSYYVSENEMAFGWPTRYLQLDLRQVTGTGNELAMGTINDAAVVWDRAVFESSETYKRRVHNLLCDNCHSHCALALDKMHYGGSSSWNMVKLAAWMFFSGRYVDASSLLKTWLPFLILAGIVITLCVVANL